MGIADNLGLDRDYIDGLAGLTGLLVYKNLYHIGGLSTILYYSRLKAGMAGGGKKYSCKVQEYLIMVMNMISLKSAQRSTLRYRDLREILKRL